MSAMAARKLARTETPSPNARAWLRIEAAAPRLAGTMQAFLARLATEHPPSARSAEPALRQFGGYLVDADPTCRRVADITRAHITGYIDWLATSRRPWEHSPARVARRLSPVRLFFVRLVEWEFSDAPARMPIKRSDIPKPPRPDRRRRPNDVPKPAPVPKVPRRIGPTYTWDDIARRAPAMAETMQAYLAQISVSSRPGTVGAVDLALRHFAGHVTEVDPGCANVAGVGRRHVESFKLALVTRPGMRPDTTLSSTTVRHMLGLLRTFFERIIDWDYPDAPGRVPVFSTDIPAADEPLPKFLDDPTAAKFMAALAADPDPRRRLLVTLLARTGMRAGEVGGITDDAKFRLGKGWWLRIPVGKLHNDRNVPLHRDLVRMIEDYQERRGPSRSGLLLERDDGHGFDRRTVHRYVAAVARRAGLRVHPHQLRHTLATQLINRGMSLEAVAALLGHRSPRMTLVYARISDESVAAQYFRATEAVEATREPEAPPGPVSHRRLLANGHCTRPAALDCAYQTMCEGCGFFETSIEFLDVLKRQQTDALDHEDLHRREIFEELIAGLTTDAPLSDVRRLPKHSSTP